MRPLASLALVLVLSGCGTIASSPFEGFGGFIADTHTWNTNPHLPMTQSETVSKVMGQSPEIEPLTSETGNVWPGPVAPSMTLEDIAKLNPDQLLKPDAEITLPNSERKSAVNPLPPAHTVVTPRPVTGSSTPPAPLTPPPQPTPTPTPVAASPAPQPAPAARFLQTPNGPATISNGSGGVVTYTDPKGNTGLVVPNGNGTSTLIAPDGSTQTVPTPK